MINFFSSIRRHTRWPRDWSSDVCSSDLRYTEKKTKFEEELRVIFQNSIRAEELKKVEKLFVTYFNSINYDTGRSYVQCSIFNKTAQLNSNQFNAGLYNQVSH